MGALVASKEKSVMRSRRCRHLPPAIHLFWLYVLVFGRPCNPYHFVSTGMPRFSMRHHKRKTALQASLQDGRVLRRRIQGAVPENVLSCCGKTHSLGSVTLVRGYSTVAPAST